MSDTSTKSHDEMTEEERRTAGEGRVWEDPGGGEVIYDPTADAAATDEDDEFLAAVVSAVGAKLGLDDINSKLALLIHQSGIGTESVEDLVADETVTAATEAPAEAGSRIDALEARVSQLEEMLAEMIASEVENVRPLPAVTASAEGEGDEPEPDPDDEPETEDEPEPADEPEPTDEPEEETTEEE